MPVGSACPNTQFRSDACAASPQDGGHHRSLLFTKAGDLALQSSLVLGSGSPCSDICILFSVKTRGDICLSSVSVSFEDFLVRLNLGVIAL